jgi:hypothetical protein
MTCAAKCPPGRCYGGCRSTVAPRHPKPNGVMVAFTLLLAVLVAGAVMWASGAFAQGHPPPGPPAADERCGPRAKQIYKLANQWLETKIAVWIAPDGTMHEIWGNPKTGTMTRIVTTPGGPACFADTGQGFQMWPYALGDDL